MATRKKEKNCPKGSPCGNSCISRAKTCRVKEKNTWGIKKAEPKTKPKAAKGVGGKFGAAAAKDRMKRSNELTDKAKLAAVKAKETEEKKKLSPGKGKNGRILSDGKKEFTNSQIKKLDAYAANKDAISEIDQKRKALKQERAEVAKNNDRSAVVNATLSNLSSAIKAQDRAAERLGYKDAFSAMLGVDSALRSSSTAVDNAVEQRVPEKVWVVTGDRATNDKVLREARDLDGKLGAQLTEPGIGLKSIITGDKMSEVSAADRSKAVVLDKDEPDRAASIYRQVGEMIDQPDVVSEAESFNSGKSGKKYGSAKELLGKGFGALTGPRGMLDLYVEDRETLFFALGVAKRFKKAGESKLGQ